ncbi:MAG TPA: type I-C CRISPR-associated protein Cas8c/Csd1, partial [Thermomicrobiales bacterium]|nr:type I-C CRISPR-associated protein Cas8c/Csd1 [Thermomicrobiales bacterium]
MVMERLREYAERCLSLPPPMYQEQPIRYIIELDRNGRAVGAPIDTANPSEPAAKRGGRRLAPHIKRAASIKPKLLADTAVYALGIPTEKDRPERVPQQQAAFARLVEQCAAATNEPAVAAVAAFLGDLPERLPALPDDFDPGAALTFRVDGVLPIDLPAVRTFWADFKGAGVADGDEADEAGDQLECIG